MHKDANHKSLHKRILKCAYIASMIKESQKNTEKKTFNTIYIIAIIGKSAWTRQNKIEHEKY